MLKKALLGLELLYEELPLYVSAVQNRGVSNLVPVHCLCCQIQNEDIHHKLYRSRLLQSEALVSLV